MLRLICLALGFGATFLRGAKETVFRTTHRVKQGCPLSRFLFVIVFEIPLGCLSSQGIVLSAFVDDINIPAPRGCSQALACAVESALSLIGFQLNVRKSESLPSSPPRPHCLPCQSFPPHPVPFRPPPHHHGSLSRASTSVHGRRTRYILSHECGARGILDTPYQHVSGSPWPSTSLRRNCRPS